MSETARPRFITDRPPEAFGLVWAYRRSLRDGRTLYVAEAHTDAFDEANRLLRTELAYHGYTVLKPYGDDAWTGSRPGFWLSERGWTEEALTRYVESLPKARAAEAEQARRKAEAAAYFEGLRRRRDELMADARASLAGRRWSWAKAEDVAEAEALLACGAPDKTGERRLRSLVDRADANVARAEAASNAPVASELGLARIPAVREAAAEAVAHITRFDADRASQRNDLGWSRATSFVGHVLAARGRDLDEAQASNALRILRTHRKQLPAVLAARVFEGAAA